MRVRACEREAGQTVCLTDKWKPQLTCTVLPVWNPHQTKIAVKEIASLEEGISIYHDKVAQISKISKAKKNCRSSCMRHPAQKQCLPQFARPILIPK